MTLARATDKFQPEPCGGRGNGLGSPRRQPQQLNAVGLPDGLGIALLTRWAVAPYVKAGVLRAVPFTRQGFKRTWSAATLKDMARVPYVREFIDLVAKHPPFAAGSPRSRGRD